MGSSASTPAAPGSSGAPAAKYELETDPSIDFDPVQERRFVVRAVHPSTGERLRCDLLERHVAHPKGLDGEWHLVRWGRNWLKEAGSTSYVREYEEDEEQHVTPANRFNKFMSFVQTVGSPGLDYQVQERVECKNDLGQWDPARIAGVDDMYYFVRYDNMDTASEWIHRFSARLRKVPTYEGKSLSGGVWDSFCELDWIRVRHPTANVHMPAKIIRKEGMTATVQYADPALLVQQEELRFDDLQIDYEKVENFRNWEARWRFNRLHVYAGALRSVGLRVHPMDSEAGHSLFRALSHQLFGTPNNYLYLRLKTLDHITLHKDYYMNFVDINFEFYVSHKKKGVEGAYFSLGDHLDIQAVCELFDARVEIYSEVSPTPLRPIRFYQQMSSLPLVRLSYRGQNHYDSVSDARSPLPLTVTRDLQEVPLGQEMSEAQVVLRAREEEFRALTAQQESSAYVREELVVTAVHGTVDIPPGDIRNTLGQLFQEVGLPVTLIPRAVPGREYQIDAHDPKEFTHASNPDVVVWYPALPMLKPGTPSMRIEGRKEVVDKAVAFIRSAVPDQGLIEESVCSRVDYAVDRKALRRVERARRRAERSAERRRRGAQGARTLAERSDSEDYSDDEDFEASEMV